MYLKHFEIQQYPFSLTPNTEFFCDLPGHQEALNVLLFGVKTGEGFIKVTGEVGSGKTIVCRKFLKFLNDPYIVAYIPNPDLKPIELRKALLHELGFISDRKIDEHQLLPLINEKLLRLTAAGKKVVLVIDEAQVLSDESLEALRLLTNLETESRKLLQVVMFAQPELNERLKSRHFRQLNQRITFSYHLQPLLKQHLNAYLTHRLSVAGYKKGVLFDYEAGELLYKASQGVPRIINILCHKSLLAAYGKGKRIIDRKAMRLAIRDSRDIVCGDSAIVRRAISIAAVGVGIGALLALYYYIFI